MTYIYFSPEAGSRVYARDKLPPFLATAPSPVDDLPLVMSLARNASLNELVVAPVHTGCVAGIKSRRLRGAKNT